MTQYDFLYRIFDQQYVVALFHIGGAILMIDTTRDDDKWRITSSGVTTLQQLDAEAHEFGDDHGSPVARLIRAESGGDDYDGENETEEIAVYTGAVDGTEVTVYAPTFW